MAASTLTTTTQQVFSFSSEGVLTLSAASTATATPRLLPTTVRGNLATVTAPDGRKLTLVCDPDGHITSLTDPLGRTWTYRP